MISLFIHTSDWHLRQAQYGKAYRGQDFFEAGCRVIDATAALGLKHIIHTGDLINVNTPPSEVVDQLLELCQRLQKHGLTMWVIDANHDYAKPSWIDVLGKAAGMFGGELPIRSVSNQGISLAIPGLTREVTLYGVTCLVGDHMREFLHNPPEKADFLLWHGMVKEFANFPSGDALAVSEFEDCHAFNSVLLGDIHVHKYLPLHTAGIIGYPGPTELCEKGQSEPKAMSVIWSNPDLTQHAVTRIDIPTRKALFLRIDSEEMFEQAIAQIITPTKAEKPMIFCKYNDAIPNFVTRLYLAANPDSIIRPEPLEHLAPLRDGIAADGSTTEPTSQEEGDVILERLLGTFIPTNNSDLFNLGRKLQRPDGKFTADLTAYVDTKLNQSN